MNSKSNGKYRLPTEAELEYARRGRGEKNIMMIGEMLIVWLL